MYKLNLRKVYRLLKQISKDGASVSQIREYFSGLGVSEIQSIKKWAGVLGLTERKGRKIFLSPLGEAALSAENSPTETKIQELMYYKITTNISRKDIITKALVDDGLDKLIFDNYYRPDWRIAAYILYDSWPENTSRMRIDQVVRNINKIFFLVPLGYSQVMVLLSKLEQERAIALEIIADLNQIGPNPSMKAEDFLEMLITKL